MFIRICQNMSEYMMMIDDVTILIREFGGSTHADSGQKPWEAELVTCSQELQSASWLLGDVQQSGQTTFLKMAKTTIRLYAPILHHTTFPMAWLIFAFPHITILARQYTLVYPLKVVGWHILYCGCVCYTQIIPGYQIIGLINLGNIYPHVLDVILCYPTLNWKT